MSSVAQILDSIAEKDKKDRPDRPTERREFKAEWLTVHTSVLNRDGSICEAPTGSALDEFEGCVVGEVRRSNHFPVPRYQTFVGVRARGRTMPSFSPRTSYGEDGKVVVDTTLIDAVPGVFTYLGNWVRGDLAKQAAQPRVQKAIQQRLNRDKGDGGNQGPQQRRTGKTERDRAKKQRPSGA